MEECTGGQLSVSNVKKIGIEATTLSLQGINGLCGHIVRGMRGYM